MLHIIVALWLVPDSIKPISLQQCCFQSLFTTKAPKPVVARAWKQLALEDIGFMLSGTSQSATIMCILSGRLQCIFTRQDTLIHSDKP